MFSRGRSKNAPTGCCIISLWYNLKHFADRRGRRSLHWFHRTSWHWFIHWFCGPSGTPVPTLVLPNVLSLVPTLVLRTALDTGPYIGFTDRLGIDSYVGFTCRPNAGPYVGFAVTPKTLFPVFLFSERLLFPEFCRTYFPGI